MLNSPEFTYCYAADRKDDFNYHDPDFWLSGRYIDYQTDSIKFLRLGPQVAKWFFAVGGRYGLANEMLSVTSLPRNPLQVDLYRHANARPLEMYFLKGTMSYFSKLNPDHPWLISEETRREMADFADVHPFLLDALRDASLDDFRDSNGGIMTISDLQLYHRIPGKTYLYWKCYFPWIIDRIYQNIEQNEAGEVTGYEIQPRSEEYLSILKQVTERI